MNAQAMINPHQRSAGHASARFAQRSGRPSLMDLRQQGSAKAIVLEHSDIVFLNTSGGLTGGDRLDYSLTL
ncbi:MAG: urease accessory protein UreD, partial [Roseinatronobacter monicus]